jgi:hypothetical protein
MTKARTQRTGMQLLEREELRLLYSRPMQGALVGSA